MQLRSSWKGSTVPEIKSGTATFGCNGESYTVNLESFQDFVHLTNIFDAVIEHTEKKLKRELKFQINQLIM